LTKKKKKKKKKKNENVDISFRHFASFLSFDFHFRSHIDAAAAFIFH